MVSKISAIKHTTNKSIAFYNPKIKEIWVGKYFEWKMYDT